VRPQATPNGSFRGGAAPFLSGSSLPFPARLDLLGSLPSCVISLRTVMVVGGGGVGSGWWW
jgi:hypothetical protein